MHETPSGLAPRGLGNPAARGREAVDPERVSGHGGAQFCAMYA